jgi:WD40 repeat protein
MQLRNYMLYAVLLLLVAGTQMQAAEPHEINLDGVVSSLENNEDAKNIFLDSLSDVDLVHWSETSRLYRQLCRKELLRRGNLFKWSAGDLKKAKIRCQDCEYRGFAFSHDGQKLAAVGLIAGGSLLQICDVRSAQIEYSFELPGLMIVNLIFSPDNRTLALTNGYDSVMVFDVRERRELFRVAGYQMSFLSDGTLLTVTVDGRLLRWNQAGEKIGSLNLEQGQRLRKEFIRLRFSPEVKKLVGSTDTSLIVWDCENGKLLKEMTGVSCSSFIFSLDSKVLACKDTFLISLLDLATGKLLRNFKGDLLSMAFFPDSIFATSRRLKNGAIRIRLRNLRTGKVINNLSDQDLVGRVIVSFSPDGKIFAAASRSNIVLWYRGE